MISFSKKIYYLFALLVCSLLIAYQSIIIVPEGHTALLTNAQSQYFVIKPGLHFKFPFLAQDMLLDNRMQTLVFQASDYSTLQAKPAIDYYINWYISNPVRYYQKTKNNLQQVNLLITQQINTLLHDEHANTKFSDIILHGSIQQLNSLITSANQQFKSLGISIVDIGFKQLQLSTAANDVLLKNMSMEQETNAITQRNNGKINAEMIHTNADNSVSLILEKAKEQAAKIRGIGDAEAAKIYNQAYLKNPEFAAFYLNLQAYQKGFNQSMNNFLVLNAKDGLLDLSNIHSSTSTHLKLKT